MGAINGFGKGRQSPHKTRTGRDRIKGMTLSQINEAMANARSNKEKHRLARRADYLVRVHGAET
jgi:hypothetical protein